MGIFVLIEYLIPPKNTATSQGEHVFFEIDVKGEEKEWSRLDAIVGGPNRLAQSFRVAINAKGGDCWHVFKQVCLSLMARLEYETMAKQRQHNIRRISTESHAVQECACSFDGKQVGKEDQQRRDNGLER
jgi:hypothetical protein